MRAVENDTDERFLVEAAQRDPARFAELYENNFDRVYGFIARRVPTRDEAQDLTAEVFQQALVNLGNFEWRGAPFVAWLLGIAINVLSSYWQRVSKRQEVALDGLDWPGRDEKVERRAVLSQLVGGLPPDQRLVILRRFVNQRSLREIAEELGRSEGAVKQLQLRALQRLRAQMRSSHE